MNINDLAKLENSWVAFNKDRSKVVKKANKLSKLLKLIRGEKDLIVTYVPSSSIYLSP